MQHMHRVFMLECVCFSHSLILSLACRSVYVLEKGIFFYPKCINYLSLEWTKLNGRNEIFNCNPEKTVVMCRWAMWYFCFCCCFCCCCVQFVLFFLFCRLCFTIKSTNRHNQQARRQTHQKYKYRVGLA